MDAGVLQSQWSVYGGGREEPQQPRLDLESSQEGNKALYMSTQLMDNASIVRDSLCPEKMG